MIRRVCAQSPDARQEMTLYNGWDSHRARGERRKAKAEGGSADASSAAEIEVRPPTPRSRSWVRLMRRIFEVTITRHRGHFSGYDLRSRKSSLEAWSSFEELNGP